MVSLPFFFNKTYIYLIANFVHHRQICLAMQQNMLALHAKPYTFASLLGKCFLLIAKSHAYIKKYRCTQT